MLLPGVGERGRDDDDGGESSGRPRNSGEKRILLRGRGGDARGGGDVGLFEVAWEVVAVVEGHG